MEETASHEEDSEMQTQLTLLAASKHDLEALRTLLRNGSANVQDGETGFTPLHAAIAACADSPNRSVDNERPTNGQRGDQSENTDDATIAAALRTAKLLLQNGAIWNDVDKANETPGCVALRLHLTELYDVMVDAGVRAEMLISRLDEYQRLVDEGSENEEEDAEARPSTELQPIGSAGDEASTPDITSGSTPTTDGLAPASRGLQGPQSNSFLGSSLRFQQDRILDNDNNGVMMAWERDIMKRTADLLLPSNGLRVLNIGHGMGIIDEFFQSKSPATHHIIEAHPEVCNRMRVSGWNDKPHVIIHEGRWQDIVPKLISDATMFDAIYFDTFAEDYSALRDFFSDSVIGLLDDGGKWGFFNGLGADRQICYDVYTKIVEMDLFEAGFDVSWERMKVPPLENHVWDGVKREYWALSEYRLPICTFAQ